MPIQRSDARVYVLLFFALLVTLVLFAGISRAYAETEVYGVKVLVTGPIASFIAIVVIFRVIGLFSVKEDPLVVRDVEPKKMSLKELDDHIDVIDINLRRLNRRKESSEKMKKALQNDQSYIEAAEEGGMTRVSRKTR